MEDCEYCANYRPGALISELPGFFALPRRMRAASDCSSFPEGLPDVVRHVRPR